MSYTSGAPSRISHRSVHEGLSEEEVAAARRQHGQNRISQRKTRGFFSHLVENLGDPMIKILLIALGINIVFLFRNADWYETAGIAVAVFVAVIVSTLSELGSESAFKHLQEEAARVCCRVIRRAGLAEVPVEEVVVGDLIKLQAGDRVPADGVLTTGQIDVDQSAMNGESKEAKKTASRGREAFTGDLLSAHDLFGGTVVCAGEGVMRVTAVGDSTLYGRLAGEVQEEKGESPLKERLSALAGTISKFGYIGAALVALAYLFNVMVMDYGFDPARVAAAFRDPMLLFERLLHAATLAVTVIVMAVPEGLPMMITVVLSSNMKRMLKDNVLVRKLVGIETAGSLNILFTDKTGTLTGGRLQVTGLIDGSGKVWDKASALYERPLWRELHRAVAYNTQSEMAGGKAVGGNPTDRALLEFVSAHPAEHALRKGRVVPFDSRSKFMATEVSGEARLTLIKGAPELLLKHCTEYIDAGGRAVPFTRRRQVEQLMAGMQRDAVRLVAVGASRQPASASGHFGDITLIGVVAVRDDVRREALQGVSQIRRAGVQVVMITGDAKATAEAIARDTGLLDGDDNLILTSEELNKLDDKQLAGVLPRLRVVARALPQDKSRLVRAAQGMGLVTGMTGDGVNDAPALKRADIGFAMGSGAEVAKEAGDIVILDDNLLSIAKAIRYGRSIFKSIRKFIIFQLTMNFCAMGVSVIAPFIGIDAPITVIQMLWINMVMDTLAGLAFGGEPALLEYMDEEPKPRDEHIINGYMWKEIALGGLYMCALCLWFLKSAVVGGIFGGLSEARFLTGFFALFMFSGILSGVCARTHHINLLDHLAGNKMFIAIMGLVTLVQLGIIYLGGSVFRTNGLLMGQLAFVLLLASTVVAAHLLRKIWYRASGAKMGT